MVYDYNADDVLQCSIRHNFNNNCKLFLPWNYTPSELKFALDEYPETMREVL